MAGEPEGAEQGLTTVGAVREQRGGQTLQLYFQNFKAALHATGACATRGSHRQIAFTQNGAVLPRTRGNGPRQRTHLVIKICRKTVLWAAQWFPPAVSRLANSLQSLTFYCRGESAQRACEPAAQLGKHHGKPKSTDGAKQQYAVKALF